MELTKEQIESKITVAEKQLKDPALANFHAKFKGMIQKYKDDLAKLDAEEKAKAEKKETTKTVAVKKSPSAKKAATKPAAKKSAEPTGKKPQINRKEKTVTIAGKTYDIEGCEAAMEIWEGVRAQRVAGSKKFSKKKEGTVIGDKIGSAAEKVVKNISAAEMKNPSGVKEKLQKMSKAMMEFASFIDDLLDDKSASKEIKDAVKTIEKFIREKLMTTKKRIIKKK